jgi:hypothetical protein
METVMDLNSHRKEIVQALKDAYVELNIIRARDGVPYGHDGIKSDVSPEYFSSVVDRIHALLAKVG